MNLAISVEKIEHIDAIGRVCHYWEVFLLNEQPIKVLGKFSKCEMAFEFRKGFLKGLEYAEKIKEESKEESNDQ